MRIAKSICVLLVLLATSAILSSCASGPVTSVDPCIEIPFPDAPEGACTNTVTHKAYLVSAEKWKEQRPHMIMIHAKGWTKIKLDWLRACRQMLQDGQKCNVAVDSIDKAITQLNAIASTLYKEPKK